LIALAVFSVFFLSVAAHAVVILTASILALWAAIEEGAWLLAIFGGFAAAIVTITLFATVCVLSMRMPFRLVDLGEDVTRE